MKRKPGIRKALREHLGGRDARRVKPPRRVVQRTRGTLRIEKKLVDIVLREPGVFEGR